MLSLLLSLFLCLFVRIATSDDVVGLPIEGKVVIPNGASTANYEVTLNGLQYSTLCRADGTFTFHNVPSGVYLVDVTSIKEIFPQIKLKVSTKDGSIDAVEYKYPGAKRLRADYPLKFTALAPVTFFQKKQRMTIRGLLFGNPMMLMMLGSLAMVIFLPKLLANLPQEELDEMTKNSGGDPMQAFQKLMGGGKGDADDDDD